MKKQTLSTRQWREIDHLYAQIGSSQWYCGEVDRYYQRLEKILRRARHDKVVRAWLVAAEFSDVSNGVQFFLPRRKDVAAVYANQITQVTWQTWDHRYEYISVDEALRRVVGL